MYGFVIEFRSKEPMFIETAQKLACEGWVAYYEFYLGVSVSLLGIVNRIQLVKLSAQELVKE